MSDISGNVFPAELTPGTVIELADLTELPAIEDAIVPLVKPDYDPELWSVRPDIKELVKPRIKGKLFYGRIGDITLTVMANPYERLNDAYERGWKIRGNKFKRESEQGQATIERYIGLSMVGLAYSSVSRSALGTVEAELYYFPIPPRHRSYGETIRRVVTLPRYDEGKFKAVDMRSRRIGLSNLRYALENPLTSAPETKRVEH